MTPYTLVLLLSSLVFGAISVRIYYNLYLHPLAKFPGPWYTSSFSVFGAIISLLRIEPQWLQGLVEKYGTDKPIRISPTMLMFPRPSALKDIYWDSKCNLKSGLYGSGVLGPPHLFTTLDGDYHKALRKALSNAPWTIGGLKKSWEDRFDDQINLFMEKMKERAHSPICLSDKVAEFAADIMTMISFTQPWGFVKNSRDERDILLNWRKGLDFFGFVGRFRFFRNYIMKIPVLNLWLLPTYSNDSGMGFLMSQANKAVAERENMIKQSIFPEKPDFLQHTLDARMNGQPLKPIETRSHVTLLIQAGADTTGTALGSTLRFLGTSKDSMAKVRKEIEAADASGNLSSPVKFEEVRVHLPYFVACIKESLRLEPPATNLFARITGPAKTYDGHLIPSGTEITSNAFIVQRDAATYAPDPHNFRPERWMESVEKANEYDSFSFVFGMGPRVCLGKDIALMEIYKLCPEIVRQFDIKVENEGRYVVAGGVAYNQKFDVQLTPRGTAA